MRAGRWKIDVFPQPVGDRVPFIVVDSVRHPAGPTFSTGNTAYSAQNVVALAGLENGKPIAVELLEQILRKLEAL